MVNFFIDRPVFASVLSIIITLVGAICVLTLPVAQYPQIVPPTVQVAATYDGASAQVVEESVATPIEQEVNGAQDMPLPRGEAVSPGHIAGRRITPSCRCQKTKKRPQPGVPIAVHAGRF